jgi:glycosyltransferase involved in cell wall biosynthesis
MYLPRRRWDTLIEAFLLEFFEDSDAELYIKVNFPSWHPIPDKPRQDFSDLVDRLRRQTGSSARVVIDDTSGTRLELCKLFDSSDYYISTDTSPTAPLGEALIRGKKVIAPKSCILGVPRLPIEAVILIEEDSSHCGPITPEILAYQPHHKGTSMPLLHVKDVRSAIRRALNSESERIRRPWPGWNRWLKNLGHHEFDRDFLEIVTRAFVEKSPSAPLKVKWEGSQFVYHSLAHVNRQLCLGLLNSRNVDLSILPFEPDDFDAESIDILKPLAACVNKPQSRTLVHVRHQWPPNFNPPPSGVWVMIQPWEFGGIPLEWIVPMRDSVDEIWVPTQWVKDCYVASGIPQSKLVVIPNGVDSKVFSPEGSVFQLKTNKRFRFLFLGGTIYRKGIDVLLAAYVHSFTSSDDVCLVIKGQAGVTYAGTELDQMIKNLKSAKQDCPEIEYLVEGLEEQQIAQLYRACDALVLPYRGEGFGLPIAEAMACGLPVIVTARGAARDFTSEDWAYLIPSEPQSLQVDGFHESAAGFWLEEPNPQRLSEAMRRVFEDPQEAKQKGLRGRAYACQRLGWEHAHSKVQERLIDLSQRKPIRNQIASQVFIFKPA